MIKWSICISKSQRILWVSFSRVVHIPVFRSVKYKLLTQLPVDYIPHPVVFGLILFLHFIRLLCDWSFRICHHITCIVIFGVSFLLAFYIVLMALFYAAIRRDSVWFLRFSFLSHVLIFSCDISLVCRLNCPYSCFSSLYCFIDVFIVYFYWSL